MECEQSIVKSTIIASSVQRMQDCLFYTVSDSLHFAHITSLHYLLPPTRNKYANKLQKSADYQPETAKTSWFNNLYDTIGEFNVDWKAEEIIILTVKPSCGVDKRKQKQSQRHSRSHCIWVFGLWWRLFHSGPSLTSQQCVGLIRIITAYSSRPTMAYPILTGASDSVIRNVLTYLVSKTYICIAHFAKASNALITSCLLVLLFRLIWSLPFFRLPPVPVSRGV